MHELKVNKMFFTDKKKGKRNVLADLRKHLLKKTADLDDLERSVSPTRFPEVLVSPRVSHEDITTFGHRKQPLPISSQVAYVQNNRTQAKLASENYSDL